MMRNIEGLFFELPYFLLIYMGKSTFLLAAMLVLLINAILRPKFFRPSPCAAIDISI